MNYIITKIPDWKGGKNGWNMIQEKYYIEREERMDEIYNNKDTVLKGRKEWMKCNISLMLLSICNAIKQEYYIERRNEWMKCIIKA